MIKEEIIRQLKKAVKEATGLDVEPKISQPVNETHGDYSSNIAMTLFSNSKIPTSHLASLELQGASKIPASPANRGEQNSRFARESRRAKFKSPFELAQKIVELLNSKFIIHNSNINKIDVVMPGFINFWLSDDALINNLMQIQEQEKEYGLSDKLKGKRIMVEFAHPNTHKEMHIGHMRTLITGEALARILESKGNKVFRANYQGDIGPHVAKALFGVLKIMDEKHLTLEEIDKWTNLEKAHFLGEGYVRGNQDYEEHKDEIGKINKELYEIVSSSSGNASSLSDLYWKTRRWSLDYYNDFYKGFYTKFDRLFFESEVSECGKKIVEENVGKVFEDSEGTIVFKGEKYDLHTRVFVTRQGYPTYEGKEMCLGFKQYEIFPFDKNIHVVGNEQASYFKVIFKALELIEPEKFKDKEFHLSMGMVNIVGMKISSRTGEILRVDDLISKVKESVKILIREGKIETEDKEKILEQIVIGAIKYSMLKAGVLQNVEFDIQKSISLEGNSGPYLQYTFARTQSVFRKAKISNIKYQKSKKIGKLEIEESNLLRTLFKFTHIVEEAAENYAPNLLCNYLFDLAQKFNLFYQKHRILDGEKKDFRLALTNSVGQVLKNGLYLLGIKAPERM